MRENYADVIVLIQKSLEPLLSKLDGKVDRLADKVDELARNRVTREDLDKLRNEIHTTFVAKDPYEVRHANLISRDSYLESEIKRIDNETQIEMQQIDERFTRQSEAQLSDKDRTWIRWNQIFSIIAVILSAIVAIVTVIAFLAQHLK